MTTGFAEIARRTIEASGAVPLVAARPAVVLERVARGGGATRWYWLRTTDDFGGLYEALSPGCVVSFYVDDRIEWAMPTPKMRQRVLAIVASDGDAVVGRLGADGLELIVDYVGGQDAPMRFIEAAPGEEPLFFGPFPAREDDGVRALTITLPDADGVIREHPH